MTSTFASRTAIALFALASLAAPALAGQSKIFIEPKYKNYRLDWCKTWGDGCGKAAAQAFCWYQDMGKVITFMQDPQPGAPTRVISTGQVCDDANCTSFKKITCAPKEGESVTIDNDGSGDAIAQQGGDGLPAQNSDGGQDNASPAAKPKIQNLGGQIIGDISVSQMKNGSGKIAVFGQGTDGALWWRKGDGSAQWDSDWTRIGGELKFSPSCTLFQGKVNCFVVGSDNALWKTAQDDNGGWFKFLSLEGIVQASPSAVAAKDENGSDALYVFVRTTGNELSYKVYSKDQETDLYGWSSYKGLGVTIGSAPTCVFMGGSHIDCYYRSSNGTTFEIGDVLHAKSKSNLGGESDKRPGVLVSSTHQVVKVLVRGTDGNLWYKSWKSGKGFSGWKSTGIEQAGQPSCARSGTSGTYWCFDVQPDKTVRAMRSGETFFP